MARTSYSYRRKQQKAAVSKNIHHTRNQVGAGNNNNDTAHTVVDDDYWVEISSKCVDAESLRLQKDLLRQAQKRLEATKVQDTMAVHVALENVHMLAARVAMLNGN